MGREKAHSRLHYQPILKHLTPQQKQELIDQLTIEMHNAAKRP